jgi:hypothetical protein
LEVMGMLRLWCFGFEGVGRLEDWSENKLEAFSCLLLYPGTRFRV